MPTKKFIVPEGFKLTPEQCKAVKARFPTLSVNLDDPLVHSQIGTELPMDFPATREMASGLIDLLERKNAEYGSSWRRRGGSGAYLTMIRKFDRLEEQLRPLQNNVFAITADPNSTESIDETIRDAINYLLLIQTMREKVSARLDELKLQQQREQETLHAELSEGTITLPGVNFCRVLTHETLPGSVSDSTVSASSWNTQS